MLIHIAKKEALEHLKSFRFLVAFIFIITTFFVMMFTRHFDYGSKRDDYLLRIKSQEIALEKYTSYSGNTAIDRPIIPPSPMEAIIDSAIMVGPGHSLDGDPVVALNIKLDMIALVGILGGLLALLLSYDAINREVNEGTVRLLLSTGVPRIKIILGKILGGSLVAILPIAIIFLITSIWLAITGGHSSDLNQWVSLLGIFLVSVFYIMFFYCLGTFVSSVVLDQTLSAFACFGVWIMFVIIVPALSPNIARSVVVVPDIGSINRQISHMLNTEYNETFGRLLPPLLAQGLSMTEAQAKMKPELDIVVQSVTTRANAMREGYKNATTRQNKLSINLACISPYSIYLVAVEELSGLSFERSQHIDSLVSSWQAIAREYMTHQYNETRKSNPEFRSSDRMDVSGMPRFKYVEPSIGYKLSHALQYILLLTAYFLLLPFMFVYAQYSKRRLF
ncbi:MAG: ABC transporter permease [Holophagaceae bacterium]|nr:ABC transporter permease [Holophagaceae bacterium]